jgi:hypothetical protein
MDQKSIPVLVCLVEQQTPTTMKAKPQWKNHMVHYFKLVLKAMID